jgi:hypothetical protein
MYEAKCRLPHPLPQYLLLSPTTEIPPPYGHRLQHNEEMSDLSVIVVKKNDGKGMSQQTRGSREDMDKAKYRLPYPWLQQKVLLPVEEIQPPYGHSKPHEEEVCGLAVVMHSIRCE